MPKATDIKHSCPICKTYFATCEGESKMRVNPLLLHYAEEEAVLAWHQEKQFAMAELHGHCRAVDYEEADGQSIHELAAPLNELDTTFTFYGAKQAVPRQYSHIGWTGCSPP